MFSKHSRKLFHKQRWKRGVSGGPSRAQTDIQVAQEKHTF